MAGRASGKDEGGGSLISQDGVVPSRIVSVSASDISQRYQSKVQKKISSGTGLPQWSRKKGCHW